MTTAERKEYISRNKEFPNVCQEYYLQELYKQLVTLWAMASILDELSAKFAADETGITAIYNLIKFASRAGYYREV